FKLYTSINLFGLILGLSCSAVIFLYVSFEFSFDNFHKDKARIFRVNEISTSPKNRTISPSLRMPYGPALKEEISEIEEVVRIRNNWHINTLKFEDKELALEKAIFADPDLFSFFSFKILSGNPKQLLADKNSIVITQKITKRIFGDKNPLGKLITYDNNTYTITGVVEDVPLNSHIKFDAVFPMETLIGTPDVFVGWDGGISATTFVKLYSSELEIEVEEKLPDFLWEKVNKKNEDSGFLSEFYLEPLDQIHLFSDVDWDSNAKNGKYVMILLFIGSLILLIAIINYLFISNGTLTLRLKEFSIKNYFGFGESNIAKQIYTESLLLFVIAGIASIILLYEFRNPISQLFNAEFLAFQIKKNMLFLAISILVISSITSFIQFVIYKRKILNNRVISSYSSPFLSKKLVYISALQFCVSIGLISSMLIVYKQLNYALHKDLGFTTENVINVSHGAIGSKQKVLINEITKLSGVANASASFGIPGLETTANGYQPEGSEQWQMFSALYVDDNFFNTFHLELLEGRNFREGANSDTKKFIVNETLAKQLNWESAVGKSMRRDGNHEIIGVVKDFHVGLIYSKIPPLIISKEWSKRFYALSIALKPGETQETIKQIENIWKNILPDAPFNYSFMDAKFESLYSEIKQTVTILLLFTGISILISILGLFGITFLLMNSKVKEIGIRKVNGATVLEIVKMLNYDFIKWVAIAFVIAVPIAWYVMDRWLQNFAYKIDISWWIFAFAGSMAFLIALITVSWQSYIAARKNPVDALRYE
ncbi:MAG: ABC transporter permease, partial [Bacteroidales bacterium]|nr:ABC transporter permease [Bacteroidales bacterium]